MLKLVYSYSTYCLLPPFPGCRHSPQITELGELLITPICNTTGDTPFMFPSDRNTLTNPFERHEYTSMSVPSQFTFVNVQTYRSLVKRGDTSQKLNSPSHVCKALVWQLTRTTASPSAEKEAPVTNSKPYQKEVFHNEITLYSTSGRTSLIYGKL